MRLVLGFVLTAGEQPFRRFDLDANNFVACVASIESRSSLKLDTPNTFMISVRLNKQDR